MRSTATSELRIRAALMLCLVTLAGCLVLSVVRDPAAQAAPAPVRGTVVDTTGTTGAADPTEIRCVPVSRAGSYTSGAVLLRNTSTDPVEVTAVRLEGARDVRIAQAYAVPAGDGEALGDFAQWPPAKSELRRLPGWLNRVKAVGEERLGLSDATSTDGGTWNLVLHLTGSSSVGTGYDRVRIDYRAGDDEHSLRIGPGWETASSCS